MSNKFKVTALLDNEFQHSRLLAGLGMSQQPKYMCMYQEPTRIFNFDKFGLYTNDKKVADYLKTRDGIVIVIGLQYNLDTNKRIETIIKDNLDKPILVFTDDSSYKARVESTFDANRPNVKFSSTWDETDALDWFNNQLLFPTQIVKKNEKVVECEQVTSATIDIHSMVKMFEDCSMPLNLWDHYGRLRIVYYSIMTYGFDATIDPDGWLCKNWKTYKTTIGHGKLWHYTLTRFWINVLFNLQTKYQYKSFDELYKNHPKIQYGSFFKKYYSDDVLFTDFARNNWVKPNLK